MTRFRELTGFRNESPAQVQATWLICELRAG